MGSISAWLPSRRSTEHHSGAFSMRTLGQRRSGSSSGNGREGFFFLERLPFCGCGCGGVRCSFRVSGKSKTSWPGGAGGVWRAGRGSPSGKKEGAQIGARRQHDGQSIVPGRRPISSNSFGAKSEFQAGGQQHEIFRLDALENDHQVSRLPYSLKILLENLLRNEDSVTVTADDIAGLADWDGGKSDREITFAPARILMQDFTGVPAVVDLAAMRDAMASMGGDPTKVNPLVPAELVIDHSVVVDVYGSADAFARNAELEFQRNEERYRFLRWGQGAFDDFRVVPPDTGICHQVTLEYLGRVVFTDPKTGRAYPDTLLGTDSHTTMINGLGVLGWGVGGIEAEAAMLGQPVSMLIPKVVGFKLSGVLPEGSTATDLVLTVTQLLRRHGVVGKFVEFYGPGVTNVPLFNRATIGNMSPEYGSTVTIFPIDEETLRYLEFTGRPAEQVQLVEAYAKAQGLWFDPSAEPQFTETLELDLSTVQPSLAGPARPQDRVPLAESKAMFAAALEASVPSSPRAEDRHNPDRV